MPIQKLLCQRALASHAHGCSAALLVAPSSVTDEYAQLVAALLFVWCVLAWLLPALLLLPGEQRRVSDESSQRESGSIASSSRNGRSGSGGGSGGAETRKPEVWRLLQTAVSMVEARLRLLKGSRVQVPGSRGTARGWDARHLEQPPGLFVLRWATLLCVTWEACCLVAPLYSRPAGWV